MSAATLHRIATPELAAAVRAAAEADNHAALAPSHVVMRDGEIVGYAAILSLPVVHVWMDTQKANMRDTLSMLSQTEAILRDRGASYYVMPCQETSPYFPLMQKAGFTDLGGNAHLLHKHL